MLYEQKRSCRELIEEATRILRKAGYSWSGEPSGKKDPKQVAFERSMVKTGFRGASRPNK